MKANTKKFPLLVLGYDYSLETLTGQQPHPLVEQADILCAGSKQLEILAPRLPANLELLPVDAGLERLMEKLRQLRDQGRKITVLAGGDPLFFGLGATLSRHFSAGELAIYPAVSSMQQACARLALPWQDMLFVSLHGRLHTDNCLLNLAQAALQDKPVCVLLDPASAPSKIAAYLLDRGRTNFRLHYFRELQNPGLEKRLSLTLQEACSRDFDFHDLPGTGSHASLLILQPLPGDRKHPVPRPYLGIPDNEFEHRAGLITKQPVRAAILAALRLRPRHTLFDLGAGCGSVGLEACALLPQGHVYAVEQNPERVSLIKANRQKHGAANLEIIQAEAGHFLQNAPQTPERIFIGGGLDKNPELVTVAWNKLEAEGRLVIACVLLGTLEKSRGRLESLGSTVEISSIQAALAEPLGGSLRLKAMNPVFILAATRPAGAG
ncbi:MAG: precorrin-6y C5,15-methyltransferase (decarboxylating) subunit CbiE [Deltaproteobacteria bacterium]|jgi:precorrin-6Y C5,15-methyltransferase (decarboxylating)|nr:precorrin-6y C5,15-methyltransferase (decarboxylating) subunit CbiE [Deltaproteobacteria bacterium]